jgi:hypothetical protein
MVDDKGLCSISFDHGKDAIDSRTNAVKNIFLSLSLSLSLSVDREDLYISCHLRRLELFNNKLFSNLTVLK